MASAWGVSWGVSWGNAWGLLQPVTPTEVVQQGGPGGSNKAGKKKHEWERRGHVISAIQSGSYLEAYSLEDLLPDETQQEKLFTDQVLHTIAEQTDQITTLEDLLALITKSLDELAEVTYKQVSYTSERLAVQTYKMKVEEEYHLRVARRRRDEEALVYILSYLV